MYDIISLLTCLQQILDRTTVKQLHQIALAMLSMTGRVTMLGIARWTEQGASYRTVQRFFETLVPWATILWLFVRQHLLDDEQDYLLAGDETVVTKAGKKTHGLDRFFSSLYGKPVPGLAFFALSLVSVQERCSYPLLIEQRVRSPEEKAAAKAKQAQQASPKRARGRPKGSKNRDKSQIELTPELRLVQGMLHKLMQRLGATLRVSYLVLDGHFGNHNTLQMVRQSTRLHLISKLRADAALYFAYEGPQKQFGPRRRYGAKINYHALPARYRVHSERAQEILTEIYQAPMLHRSFAQALNVVIVMKTNLTTGAQAHVVLFSSDLALSYERLIDYYKLRFQLEFNFRDAKQFWGLEDFMNIKERALTNAVNLAFFMVNLSHALLRPFRLHHPQAGILDLKASFRRRRYAVETLNNHRLEAGGFATV
jgi:putative transposase